MRGKVKEETKYLSPTSHRLKILDLINHIRRSIAKRTGRKKQRAFIDFGAKGIPALEPFRHWRIRSPPIPLHVPLHGSRRKGWLNSDFHNMCST